VEKAKKNEKNIYGHGYFRRNISKGFVFVIKLLTCWYFGYIPDRK